MRRAGGIATGLLAMIMAGCGGGPTPDAGTPCVPACRQGFVCANGACVSPCNPPCAEGEVCTADLQCVPPDAGGVPADAGRDSSPVVLLDAADAKTPVSAVVRIAVQPIDKDFRGFFFFQKRGEKPKANKWCFTVEQLLRDG